MSSEITDETFERVDRRIAEYARLCGRSALEVTLALLASKTLQMSGYTSAQNGRLTEEQGRAAVKVLDYWIGAKIANRRAAQLSEGAAARA